MRIIRYGMSAVLAASTLSACATKGFVRKGLEDQRVALTGSITQERGERVAGDEALKGEINTVKADLAALRADLTGLKTEFGARISAVENQVIATPQGQR